MKIDFASRGQRFRDSVEYIRAVASPFPDADLADGRLSGQADMLPKPAGGKLALFITGSAQQSLTGSRKMVMDGLPIRVMLPVRGV